MAFRDKVVQAFLPVGNVLRTQIKMSVLPFYAPQGRNVSNRRWSGRIAHAEPAAGVRKAPTPQGLNVQPLQGWRVGRLCPPVPLTLHRRLLTLRTCGARCHAPAQGEALR